MAWGQVIGLDIYYKEISGAEHGQECLRGRCFRSIELAARTNSEASRVLRLSFAIRSLLHNRRTARERPSWPH
jgi:hypothetical protein